MKYLVVYKFPERNNYDGFLIDDYKTYRFEPIHRIKDYKYYSFKNALLLRIKFLTYNPHYKCDLIIYD